MVKNELYKESAEKVIGSSCFSSRFNALRTLTTALLFASSSKFVDVPRQDLLRFPAISEVFGFGQTWLNLPGNYNAGLRANDSVQKESSFQVSHDDRHSNRLPRSRKSPRHWRKSRHNTSEKTPPNNRLDQPTSCACDITSFRQDGPPAQPVMKENHERTNLSAYLEYSYMIINSIETFLRPKFAFHQIFNSYTVFKSEPDLMNSSELDIPNENLFWIPKDNYSPFIAENEPHRTTGPFIPLWLWDSLCPYSLLQEPFQGDWKTGSLSLVT